MSHFFETLWEIIQTSQIPEKIANLKKLAEEFFKNPILPTGGEVKPLEKPSYASFCKIVKGSQVPKRRRLDTREGRVNLVHALAHIEYSAIDLALDHAYRFRNLPITYYFDWITTALEEAKHFCLLENILHDLGSYYGDLPVHDGLFRAALRSQESLAMRMAAIPRYMEARGLDAHPQIQAKLSLYRDPVALRLKEILEIIAIEEIEHVKRGDRWFRYALEKEKLNLSDYISLVSQAVPGAKIFRTDLNYRARLAAGFTQDELELYTFSNRGGEGVG